MKEEYDFSKGTRGKFYQSEAQLNLPMYLDADILDYLSIKAKAKGVAVNEIVNDLLRKDIALIEGMN
ncbi:MAG: BrnA antitoxin family protein [Nitrosospira sp.]|nr:BrnA antitoxin family protein [Nitrosospira sp.]MDN5880973.1 BrnA antitoxin family protein [Nitrosospira sp.]MDN5936542.1 BrnA antitoxin family protein [Nitrosospira sp.]